MEASKSVLPGCADKEISEKNKQLMIGKRLSELDCPFVEDDETWILQLFQPSETRLRILTWLIGKFDHKLADLITKHAPAADNHIDSRMQRMLFVCSMMGLCKASDLEIVKGTTSKKKQAAFWEDLIDLVFTSESTNYPSLKYEDRFAVESLGYASDGSPERNVAPRTDCYENLCRLTDNLVRQESTKDLFSSTVSLFPPDLERLFHSDEKNSLTSVPDNSVLRNISVRLAADEETIRKEFKTYKEKLQYSELCQSNVDQQCKKLSLAITMLKQLITNFLHCYDIHLKQWCNRPKAKKSGLGSTFRRTFQMAMNENELLEQMQILEDCYHGIKCNISEQLNSRKSNSEIGHESLMNLRQTIDILRESELRIKDYL